MLEAHMPAASPPLGRAARSLPDLLAERLLAAIVSGQLPAGERLKEVTLAQEHAVSRATVREALIILARSGLVERVARFGARVTAHARDDVAELFELRAVLLGVAARRCARQRAADVVARLTALTDEMERLAADPDADPQAFGARSIAAQELLVGRCGNHHLPEVYDRLAGMSAWRLIRGQATSFLTAERRAESARDWRRLLGLAARGDADGAEAAARTLLSHAAAGVRLQMGAGADAEG